MFKLFSTFKSSRQQNSSGIGLGLVICKAIVEFYDGSITVDSKVDQGSEFTFTFEVAQQDLDHLRVIDPPDPEVQEILDHSGEQGNEGGPG